jgi:peptide/nickel transport system substrate-binding protein
MVDRVEWKIMPDPATATAALGQGEVDVYETPPMELLAGLKKNPNVVVAVHNTLGAMAYYRPNFLFPPFDNVKARQALLYVADQSEYMQAAIGSDPTTWRVCWAFLACGSQGGSEAGAEPFRKPDPAKAKALFQEAGYKGEKIVVMQPTDQPVLKAVTEVAVQRLKEIGLNLDVQAMNWGTLVGRRAKMDPPEAGGWNLFFTWTFGLDLANPLANAALAAPCDKKNYPGWPCDDQIEKLRDAWGKAADATERQKVAVELQERSVAFVPYAPVGQYTQPIAYRSTLKNFIKVPLPVMWGVDKQ